MPPPRHAVCIRTVASISRGLGVRKVRTYRGKHRDVTTTSSRRIQKPLNEDIFLLTYSNLDDDSTSLRRACNGAPNSRNADGRSAQRSLSAPAESPLWSMRSLELVIASAAICRYSHLDHNNQVNFALHLRARTARGPPSCTLACH